MPDAIPRVYLVVATYGRPELLGRLLASVATEIPALAGAVVVNNSGDSAGAQVARMASPVPLHLITPAANLGTGGGLAEGLRAVLTIPEATHAWIMDDDACATPGALAALLAATAGSGAGAAAPLVIDAQGAIAWFPGPLAQPAWNVIRQGVTPTAFRARCGTGLWNWRWATWASLLVTRAALEATGLPRSDLWFQSTDTEYTLRLSARFRCVLAASAVCAHLPPPETTEQRRRKDRWTLQNNAFLSVRLRHGWRALRHLPGNHLRYWQRYRGMKAMRESLMAFWRGAIQGRPVAMDEYQMPRRMSGGSAAQTASTE